MKNLGSCFRCGDTLKGSKLRVRPHQGMKFWLECKDRNTCDERMLEKNLSMPIVEANPTVAEEET